MVLSDYPPQGRKSFPERYPYIVSDEEDDLWGEEDDFTGEVTHPEESALFDPEDGLEDILLDILGE